MATSETRSGHIVEVINTELHSKSAKRRLSNEKWGRKGGKVLQAI